MTILFLVLIIAACVALGFVVLIQNPKGGGLSSSFGGGGTQQLGGVQKTTDFLDKSTWFLAIFLIALILASNFAIDNTNESIESKALNTEEVETQALPFNNSQDLTLPVEEN